MPVGARPCAPAAAPEPARPVPRSMQLAACRARVSHGIVKARMQALEQIQSSALPWRASCVRQHVQGGQQRRAGACGRTLAIPNPTLPHPTPGVDPKSIVCEFFRHGKCTKGFKCKFAHDLAVERKGGKIDIFSDRCARLGTRAPEARVPPWSPATGPGSLRAGCALHEHFAACSACACGLVCGFATL